MKTIFIAGILTLLSACGSKDSSQAAQVSAPISAGSVVPTAKALMSSWTDPVSGNVLDLEIKQGGIETPNVSITYIDLSLNSWENSVGTAWQSIQIGTASEGGLILGSPSPEFSCSNCSNIGILNNFVPWPAGTYSYTLSENALHVCNSASLCWDLE